MNERGDEIAQSRTELPVKPNCTTPGIFCYGIKGNFSSIYLKKKMSIRVMVTGFI